LPDGKELTSLREAIAHLVNTVPAAERQKPAVLTAAEMLTGAAEERPDRVRAHRDSARVEP
jgi:hypothetical protein